MPSSKFTKLPTPSVTAPGAADPSPGAPLAGTAWQVRRLDGTAVGDPAPTLEFGTGRLTGGGGCNGFSAPLSGRPEALRVGPPVAGERMCARDVWRQERRFFDLLTRVARAEIDAAGAGLTLSDGSGRAVIEATRR